MPERTHRTGGRAAGPAWRWRLLAAGAGVLLAPAVGAHAFGQRYDLPLPLSYFLLGGGLTVALSFVVVAAAARAEGRKREYPRFDLRRTAAGRTLSHPLAAGMVRALGVVLFLTVLVAGFYGVQNPFRNIVPTLVWIVGWIGLAYVCALFGDLWALLNPYRTLHRWTARLRSARARLGSVRHGRLSHGPCGARFSWYTALVAIVIGHVIAMYVAHVTALRHFRERSLALRSQYLLAALMVAYTVLSLWILAQPVVEQVPHG